MKKKIKELTIHLYETLYEYLIKNNQSFIKDLEKKLKIKILLVKDNSIAPPFFILKTTEPNNKKNKPSVIYDDVPKLSIDEETKENNKDSKVEKKVITKNKVEKKEKTKKKIEEKKESINESSSLVK